MLLVGVAMNMLSTFAVLKLESDSGMSIWRYIISYYLDFLSFQSVFSFCLCSIFLFTSLAIMVLKTGGAGLRVRKFNVRAVIKR